MTTAVRRVLVVMLVFLVWAPAAYAWSWPVQGPVLRPFVYDESHPYAAGQHRGIDIGADGSGGPIAAPAAGTVSFAGSVPASGKSVTIETGDGYSVTLTHLGSILVVKGAAVTEGDPVGTVGPSGTAELDQPYVHLGIRVTTDPNGYVDPLSLLPAPDVTGGSTGAGSDEGGSTADGSTGDGSTAGGSVTDGSTGDGSSAGGSTADGSTGDGSSADGSATDGYTGDGSTADGSATDGSAAGGSDAGGSATGGSATGGSATGGSTSSEPSSTDRAPAPPTAQSVATPAAGAQAPSLPTVSSPVSATPETHVDTLRGHQSKGTGHARSPRTAAGAEPAPGSSAPRERRPQRASLERPSIIPGGAVVAAPSLPRSQHQAGNPSRPSGRAADASGTGPYLPRPHAPRRQPAPTLLAAPLERTRRVTTPLLPLLLNGAAALIALGAALIARCRHRIADAVPEAEILVLPRRTVHRLDGRRAA